MVEYGGALERPDGRMHCLTVTLYLHPVQLVGLQPLPSLRYEADLYSRSAVVVLTGGEFDAGLDDSCFVVHVCLVWLRGEVRISGRPLPRRHHKRESTLDPQHDQNVENGTSA
jgi:hypothetical protein